MSDVIGVGQFAYRPRAQWGDLPAGWVLGDVAAVAVDDKDRVYVFHRGEHPMVVFDRSGKFLRSWGDGIFVRPHGLHIAADQTIFCTDAGDHSVRQFTLDGTLLLTLGTPGSPSSYQGGKPFNRCTHTALSPNGDIFVSDGYGNSRVHRYAPDGRLLTSWGEPGTAPGQFNLPHNISCDDDGFVYVADRENHRIQVFDNDGRFEAEWHNLHRPSAMYMTPGSDPVFYIGEIGPYLSSNRGWPNLGPRISVMSKTGELLARLDSPVRTAGAPGGYLSPHSIVADSRGDIYVGDVCFTAWPSMFPDEPVRPGLQGLHKYEKVPAES